jgi:hypothetical protein
LEDKLHVFSISVLEGTSGLPLKAHWLLDVAAGVVLQGESFFGGNSYDII